MASRLLLQGVKAKRKGHAIVIKGKAKYLEWTVTGEEKQGFRRQLARRMRGRGRASR